MPSLWDADLGADPCAVLHKAGKLQSNRGSKKNLFSDGAIGAFR